MMMRPLLMGVALAAATMTVPVAARAAVVAPATEQKALATQLVRTLNSEALTRAQLSKMLGETLPKTLAANPTFAGMERQHPGVTNAFIEAMRPVIIEGTIAKLPSLWARLEPIYVRTFTAAELHVLINFYTSPAGVRVIQAMGEGADYSRMLGDMLAKGNHDVTQEGLSAGVQTGVAQVVRAATDEDMKAMQALAATSAGQKLTAVNQQVQAEAVAWGNEPDPELNAKVAAAVGDVAAKYFGKPAQ
jgi:hypothetical protein